MLDSLTVAAAILMVPLADLIDRAARRAAVSHKELAICQGIAPSQWSSQLHGTGHVALDRLDRTPITFRRALLEELWESWTAERPLTARDVLDLIRPVMAPARPTPTTQEESCA